MPAGTLLTVTVVELPVAEVVRVWTVLRLPLGPLLRRMVQPASQPEYWRVNGWPVTTLKLVLRKAGWAATAAAKARTAAEYFILTVVCFGWFVCVW